MRESVLHWSEVKKTENMEFPFSRSHFFNPMDEQLQPLSAQHIGKGGPRTRSESLENISCHYQEEMMQQQGYGLRFLACTGVGRQ